MRITQKIATLVAVPLVAVVAFAALAVSTTGGQAVQAEQLRTLVATGDVAGELLQTLQDERNSAVFSLTDDSGKSIDNYLRHAAETDNAIATYKQARGELTEMPPGTEELLDRIDDELDTINEVRKRVVDRDQTASATAFAYRIVTADLLTYRDSVVQVGAAPAEVSDRIRAAAVLSRAGEFLAVEQVTVIRAIDAGRLTSTAQQEVTAARTGYADAMQDFDELAPIEWQRWLKESMSGPEAGQAQKLEDEVSRTSPGESIDIELSYWTSYMTNRSSRLLHVQARVDDAIVDEVTALRDTQLKWTAAQVIMVIATVAAALAMALWLGRPVVRGLRRLRASANYVAKEGLPEAVAQLDDHQVLGEMTPEEFADVATPPVEVEGKDELAEVAKAFNNVHKEAIRVAAQQALLRVHIGAIFVRLARRGHSLAGRLTTELDEAERTEQDPDRLERLFALDHLVTLFARSNDSLLVLGGASPAKPRSTNESVTNVLKAAQGQIELYKQVQIGLVDEGVAITASAVDDVVKLIAELMDNATRYSEPQVNVTARLLADRMVIQINDRGIGISEQTIHMLNARLATRSPLDLDAVKAMGLTVVGHIAARHGILVELRAAQTGGTLAEVSLPTALLESKDTKPRALPAGPANRPAAPLFQGGGDTPEPPVEQALPATRDTSDESVGMPIVHFDWREVDASGEQPIVAESEWPPRQREEPARPSGVRAFDDGRRAAERVAEAAVTITGDGLPKRTPMENLVPGAIEDDSTQPIPVAGATTYRDPAAVGATYAAYARGLAGNRNSQSTTDGSRK